MNILDTYSDSDIKLLAHMYNVKGHSRHDICNGILIHLQQLQHIANSKCNAIKAIKPCNIQNIRHYALYICPENVSNYTPSILEKLFQFYDDQIFDGLIWKTINNNGYTIKFKTTGRETFTTEGYCIHNNCNYTIIIPISKFNKITKIKYSTIAGHSCNSQLDCLLRVVEHELIHLLIFTNCKDTVVADQHNPLFMGFIKELFQHTDIHHQL